MKKQLLFSIATVLSAMVTVAQSPITITQEDQPVYVNYLQYNIPPFGTIPIGENLTWDLSSYSGSLVSIDYFPEFDPFFLDAGVDVYYLSFQNLTPTFGYYLDYCIDFNINGIDEIAGYVYAAANSIGGLTGNNNDSIIFPLQKIIFNGGRRIMQFPSTLGTTVNSVSRREVNFIINAPALGLNYAECKHIFTVIKDDEIDAWGKMRAYTPTGPSIYYDVLGIKTNQVTVDSFYVNGAPAPAQLLSSFGVSQGQSVQNRRHFFYRKGSSTPLLAINYADNFATPSDVFTDRELETAASSSLNETESKIMFSGVFPNPTNHGSFNVLINNNDSELNYRIVELNGKVVSEGNIINQSGMVNLSFPNNAANGIYNVQLFSKNGNLLTSEQIILSR